MSRKIDKNLTKCKITNISNNLRRQIERMGLHFFSWYIMVERKIVKIFKFKHIIQRKNYDHH